MKFREFASFLLLVCFLILDQKITFSAEKPDFLEIRLCRRRILPRFPYLNSQLTLNSRRSFMGLEKLISVIATLVVLAASTGQLPRLIREVRSAQAHLIQDTKASTWGMPMLLKGSK
jgi:hypothetical protein